jgi:putative spermidine/putrescine transport system ATP-binding protein
MTDAAPAFLDIDRLSLGYGRAGFRLSAATFHATKGEVVALLGPSGCGKTTLLNSIAGFLHPEEGHVRVGGRDLVQVPPHRRDMAMVFQNYALFPHLSVAKNVAFGLEARGVGRDEIRVRVGEALAMVGLAEISERYPRQLSGGQQQRVALARALVIRPSVLLLDEPLSNLDALLRKTMREEIREILKQAAITAVLVTHDQEEALVIADRIVLMSNGRIDQIGTPADIYERPRTVFCARFMAFDNLLDGTLQATGAGSTFASTPIGTLEGRRADVASGAAVVAAVRAERVRLLANGESAGTGENGAAGRIVRVTYHGTFQRLEVACGDGSLIVHVPVGSAAVQPETDVRLAWAAADTHILPS